MAEDAHDIHAFAESLHRGAKDFAEMHKHAQSMSDNIRDLTLSFAGIRGAETMLRSMFEHSRFISALKRATSLDRLNEKSLDEAQLVNQGKIVKMEMLALDQRKKWYDLDLANLRAEERTIQAQFRFNKVLEDTGKIRIALATIGAGLMVDVLFRSRQFNQSLIEANSNYSVRNGLMSDTLMLSVQLGASFDDVTQSAQALVHYNMNTSDTWEDNLRIVTQLSQGVGVSVSNAAQLASIVERQVHGSFAKVADVVAQLVNDTSLAGNEAGRLAINMGQVVGRVGGGLGGDALPEVLKVVGRYESALKGVSGQSGGFEALIQRLTSTEGMVGAGALGANPNFIGSAQGTETVLKRFAVFGDRMVGMSTGWERQMRLDLLGEMFGTSAAQANELLIASKQVQEATVGDISLQDRWREQMDATNQGVTRLYNSLVSLAEGGLYYVIKIIGYLANQLADFVDILASHRYVVGTVMGVLAFGFVAAIFSMKNLALALYDVALAGKVAAVRSAMAARSEASKGVAGVSGSILAGMGQKISFLLWAVKYYAVAETAFTLMVAGISAAVAAIGWLGYLQFRAVQMAKESLELQKKSDQLMISKSDMLVDKVITGLGDEARQGTLSSEGTTAEALERVLRKTYSWNASAEDRKKFYEQVASDKTESALVSMMAGAWSRTVFKDRITDAEQVLQKKQYEEAQKIATDMRVVARQMIIIVDGEKAERQAEEVKEAIRNATINQYNLNKPNNMWSLPQ